MIITVKQIQIALNEIWPDLEQIWCFDQEYVWPTRKEIEQFVRYTDLGMSKIKAKNPDCDDFALQLHADAKRFANWSFGEAFADKVGGWSTLHNLNICYCQSGVLMIDAKDKTVRLADPVNDNILWVRM